MIRRNASPFHERGDETAHGERGSSLVEALVSILILGVVVAGIVPSFLAYTDVNTRNEIRTGAVQAGQQAMERHRLSNPTTMPTTGATSETITVDDRDFTATTTYCADSSLCGANSRHLSLEVTFNGETLYKTETVYTELK